MAREHVGPRTVNIGERWSVLVEKRIGEGGFSHVFRAVDKQQRRDEDRHSSFSTAVLHFMRRTYLLRPALPEGKRYFLIC